MADLLSVRPESTPSEGWWFELTATLLLGLAAVGAGWAAYQSALWSSDQTFTLDRAWVARRDATVLQNRAYVVRALHVGLFVDYLQALRRNDTAAADFLLDRFPPPLRTATNAWLATKPLKNPQAPSSPFVMKEYEVPEDAEAKRLEEQGKELTSKARREDEISDDYVLLTVPFAIVSLFAGLSSVVKFTKFRSVVVAIASAVFVGAVAVIASMPVN